MEIFIGLGTYHIERRTKHIKRWIGLVLVQDKLEFIGHSWQFAFDACPRFAAARAHFDTICIAFVLCFLIDVAEDGE